MAEPENVQTDPATSTTPPAVGDGVVVDESNVTNGPGMPTKKRRGASRLFRGLQHVSSSPSLSRAGRARSASSPYSLSGTLSCVSLASTSSPFGPPSTGSYFSQSSAAGNWSPGTSIPATPIPELISRGNHEEMPAARPVDGTAQMGSTTATLPATVKRKAKSFSLWHSMPHELKIYILSFLRPKELVRASRVSKEFHDMCFDGQLWTRLDASAFYKDITAEALEKIVVRAGPFVKDLNLRGCVQVEHYQKTEAMVDACQNLVNVTLEGCRNLKRATLHRLLQTNPKLAYLNLTGLPAVTNTTCSIIAQSCPQLEVLNLSWCKHADARGIKDIVTSCTRLRDLRAGEIKGFDKPDVAEAIFHRGSDTLERLVLAGCDDLSDRALGIMLHGRSPDIDLLTGIPVVRPENCATSTSRAAPTSPSAESAPSRTSSRTSRACSSPGSCTCATKGSRPSSRRFRA
jgi:F-box/leucine-rich repeat protein 2/20